MTTTYRNTAENAAIIGWTNESVAEYVKGDRNLPYMIHDERRGTFTYSAVIKGDYEEQARDGNAPEAGDRLTVRSLMINQGRR